ncbi:MAG: hypothetical protein JWP44_3540 [Mucilaginibacter sp.]|nr:hypothetical protein [Mucilaginibacter sp.]
MILKCCVIGKVCKVIKYKILLKLFMLLKQQRINIMGMHNIFAG